MKIVFTDDIFSEMGEETSVFNLIDELEDEKLKKYYREQATILEKNKIINKNSVYYVR